MRWRFDVVIGPKYFGLRLEYRFGRCAADRPPLLSRWSLACLIRRDSFDGATAWPCVESGAASTDRVHRSYDLLALEIVAFE